MRTTTCYIVSDWRKTRCPVECEESRNFFGPACPHQNWFPIPHRVVLVTGEEGEELRCSCTEGKKPGGPRCRSWDEEKDCCPHVELARKVLDGTAEERERGRAELSLISTSGPRAPRCSACGETWCVGPVDGAGKGRWKRKHRKQLKNGGEVPEELWMCRHPNCRDEKGLPWVWEEGTEERPKTKRHGIVIDERLW